MARTITSAFASVVTSKVAKMLTLAVMTPVIVRILGPRLYGEYAAVMALFGLLMIIVSSGISSGGQKYLAEDRSDPLWKEHVFGYYLRVATLFALVAAVALIVATQAGAIRLIFDPHYATYFYLLVVLTFAAQYREYVRRSLMGLKLEHVSEPLTVLYKFGFGIFAITLTYLGFGVVGMLAGHILASLLVFVLGAFVIARHINVTEAIKPLPDEFPRSELWGFNNLSIVYFFLLTSLYDIDVLMVEAMMASESVGYYKAALVMVHFLWFVPKSAQAVLIQSTADLWANDRIDKINAISSRVVRYTLLIGLLLAIGLGALAADFVPLYYGAEFTPAIIPLLLLLPGTIGFAMARPLLAITHAKGSMNVMIGATGASAVLNFVLNALLIPQFGTAGAAVATSIGYGSLPVFHVLGARRIGYNPLGDIRVFRIGITAAISGVAIVALAGSISHPILSLVVVPPVGFLIYSLLALATGAIGHQEILGMLEDLPGPSSQAVAAIEQRLE